MMTNKDDEDDSRNRQLVRVTPGQSMQGVECAELVRAPRGALSRRSVLKSLALIPLTAAALTLTPLATVATAEVVAVIVAVVGIVLALVKMFGKSGPGIGDLLNLQVQLLLNISAQLENVQKGIELILNRIDDVERLIGKIPVQTVEAINKHRIIGISRIYDEKKDAFYAVKEQSGLVTKAQERYAADLKASIVHPLQEARADLMSVDSVFNVPFIGVAFQMEIHSMVMAGADRHDLEPILRSYRTWFEQTRTTLDARIAEKRARRIELRAKLEKLNGFRSACATNKEKTQKGNPPRHSREGDDTPDTRYLYYTATGKLADFSYPLKLVELPDRKQLDELLSISLLTPDDLPMTAVPTPTRQIDFWVEDNGGPGRQKSTTDLIPLESIKAFYEPLQYCGKDGPIATHPDVPAISKEMDDSGMSLISLATMHLACTKGVEACNKFAQSLVTGSR